jgi:TRIAD3 protein (E3 ubiquitin-protein ligase RNF216)
LRGETPLFLPDESDDEFSDHHKPVKEKLVDSVPGVSYEKPIIIHDVDEIRTLSRVSPPSEDLVSRAVVQVLDIIPDVEPNHLSALIGQSAITHGLTGYVEHVLHTLFEDPTYPKIVATQGKGKRKRAADDDNAQAGSSKKIKVEYRDISREKACGPNYPDLALVNISFLYSRVARF